MAEPVRKRSLFDPPPATGGTSPVPEPKSTPGVDEAALTQLVQRLITEHIESPREEAPGRATGRTLEDHPGDHVGPYRILTRIGRGRLGEVWLAEQRQPPAGRVALEIVRPGVSPQGLARYEDEHRLLAGLEHPNLAGVLETGPGAGGRRYFAMEYVHGEPVLQYADRSLLNVRERVDLMIPVCEALQRAHALGVPNGALGSRSVLVCDVGGRALARVLRYGVGTPRVSQDEADGPPPPPDARSDIHALGVLLHELVVGRAPAPHKGGGRTERPSTLLTAPGTAVAEIVRRRHAGLDDLVAAVEGRLDEILLKAIASDPREGYASLATLADDLGHYLAGRPLHGQPRGEPEGLPALTWRRARPLVIGACVVLTLVLVATAIGRRASQPGPKLDRPSSSVEAERQALAGALAKSEAAASAAEGERQRLAEATARSEASARAAEAERQKLAALTAKSEASLKQVEGERVRLAELSAKAEQAVKDAQAERDRLGDLSAKAERAAKDSEAQRLSLVEAQAKAQGEAQAAEAERTRLAEAVSRAEQTSRTDEGLRQRLVEAEARARELADTAEADRRRVGDAIAQSQAAAASAEAERGRLAQASARAEKAAQEAEGERDRLAQARARAEKAAEEVEAERDRLAAAAVDSQTQAQAAAAERRRLADLAARAEAEAQAAREQREELARLTDQAEAKAEEEARQREATAREAEARRQEEAQRQEQARQEATRRAEEAKALEEAQAATRREEEARRQATEEERQRIAAPVVTPEPATPGAVVPTPPPIEDAPASPVARPAPRPGDAIIAALVVDARAAREQGTALPPAGVDDVATRLVGEVPDPARQGIALEQLGEALAGEAMPGLGARVLRRALETAKSSLGADHADTLRIRSRLGSLLLDDSKPSAGEQALREAWEGFKRTRGPGHADTLRTMGRLGDALIALGRSHDAARLLGEGEASARVALADDGAALGAFLGTLGEARLGQRAYAPAETLLIEASEKLSIPAASPTPRAARCAALLVTLYERWNAAEPGKGYDARAEQWKAK